MLVEANGISVHCEVSGREDQPFAALSHSLGSSMVMWEPQLPALEQRFRVLRYDTRGHGDSSASESPYSLDQLGDDAIALFDALDIGPVHWIGLSMGGMIGQNIALRHPERLLSLVLADTSAQVPQEAQAVWEDRIQAVRDGGMGMLAEATMQRWFTPAYLREDPPAVMGIRAQFANTAVEGYVGCCRAIQGLDHLDRLGEITLATLIIVGAEDLATPVSAAEAMNARIAGSTIVVLDHAAHLSNIEQAVPFDQALANFFDGQQIN